MEHQKQHQTCTLSRNDNEARKKHNSALQTLKEERKKTEQLRYELEVINAENKSMELMLKTRGCAMGRKQIAEIKYDGFMKANKSTLTDFLRHKVFPHHKLLHISWSFYTPKDGNSLWYKILGVIDWSRHCDIEYYWINKVVPLFSATLIESQSKANEAVHQAFKSEWH